MRLRTVFLLAAGLAGAALGQTNSTSSTTQNALRTCTLLQSSLGSDVVQFSGAEYLASAENAWSLFNTENMPPCIVFPRNATQVQVTMAAIFHNKIHYAVQAGGHSAMTGWNTYA